MSRIATIVRRVWFIFIFASWFQGAGTASVFLAGAALGLRLGSDANLRRAASAHGQKQATLTLSPTFNPVMTCVDSSSTPFVTGLQTAASRSVGPLSARLDVEGGPLGVRVHRHNRPHGHAEPGPGMDRLDAGQQRGLLALDRNMTRFVGKTLKRGLKVCLRRTALGPEDSVLPRSLPRP